MAKKTLVRDLMISNVKTVKDTATVLDAAKVMTKNNIGAVIVLDSDAHTVGIFTERDLLKKVVSQSVDVNLPVKKFMTSDLVCVQLHDEMDKIPDLMVKGGFRHVPVMDGFEPIGILSIRDILSYVLKKI